MINRRLLVVTSLVVNDTQVDMGEELASDVSDLLMSRVVIDGISIVCGVALAKLHVIYTDAVVG